MTSNTAPYSSQRFDVIVIAASAGGLQTLFKLIKDLPASFPVPIIIVQHVSPDYPSLLAEILARKTSLTVAQAADQDVLRAGHIYTAAPDHHLGFEAGGKLKVSSEPRQNFHRPSADWLFESAAEVFGSRVVAVVLTGTGTDGSRGIDAVKQAGGMVIVEDPQTALFAGMPEAAIQTGHVDTILPVDEIASLLCQLTGTVASE